MTTGRVRILVEAMVISAAMLAVGAGCASKQVASTSGDQSTTMKGKTEAPGPVESVQQDQMTSIAAPSTMESTSPGESSSSQTPSASVPAAESSAMPGSSHAPAGAAQIPGQAGVSQGDVAGVSDIFFDFDQYNIRGDAQAVLDANAAWLRSQPGKSLIIEGHCDERGTLAYNLVLGEKRARSTKRYLEDLGIPGSRIQTTSYGEVRPFCKDHNEGCWSKNRRAHFVVQ